MKRQPWEIVVVDTITKPWPSPRALVDIGVPLKTAVEYMKIRRRMSSAGLKRWASDHRN